MKIVIKKSRIRMALVKQLEAAGFTVILILSGSAGAAELERGDLKSASIQAEIDQAKAAEALKLTPAVQTQPEATVVAEQD